ncbi:unnamed protein product, partial [Heterosigma akashiwo]
PLDAASPGARRPPGRAPAPRPPPQVRALVYAEVRDLPGLALRLCAPQGGEEG